MSESDLNRYKESLHKMQTGVAFMMNHTKETEPKHLRVGVNAAMSDQGGLVELLIQKGVFTLDEYRKAIADSMEREADSYQKMCQEKFGPDVKVDLH